MMYLIKSKLSIKPWWVTGIVDSEGNFSINYNINKKNIIIYVFIIILLLTYINI